LAHHNCFWNIGHSQIEAQRCFPLPLLYSLYTWSSILAKAYEIKSVVLLGTHWELDGKLFGTWCKHIGNNPKKHPPFAISLGQKWWQTVLGIKISCNQWEGWTCTHNRRCFFIFGVGWGEGNFFWFFIFILNMFPSSSLRFFKFPSCYLRRSH